MTQSQQAWLVHFVGDPTEKEVRQQINKSKCGRQTSRKMQPDASEAQRHPKDSTPTANKGEMRAPPTGTAALTTVIARARRRMNQLLAMTIGEWTKPAMKAREITPR